MILTMWECCDYINYLWLKILKYYSVRFLHTACWLSLQSHQLVPEHRFFDHIAYYCSSVNFNKFLWSRLCNDFESICVYDDWMIDFVKMLSLMNFCWYWLLQIVFLGFFDEHVYIFSWIFLISHVFWKIFRKF